MTTTKRSAMRRKRKRAKLSVAVALRRAAERRALDLAVLSDRQRGRALKDEKTDWRALVALEEAAAVAAAAVGSDKKALARTQGNVAAGSVEVRFVSSDVTIWEGMDEVSRRTFVQDHWAEITRLAIALKLLPPMQLVR
jgi:hypothetical protein